MSGAFVIKKGLIARNSHSQLEANNVNDPVGIAKTNKVSPMRTQFNFAHGRDNSKNTTIIKKVIFNPVNHIDKRINDINR
jgi:hypothetical protein